MIEIHGPPAIHVMADLAGHREARCAVVHHAVALELALVAEIAVGAQAGINARGGAAVTRLAFDLRVRAQKRKPVLVRPERLDGGVPPAHRVALLAVGSELRPVNIGVAS